MPTLGWISTRSRTPRWRRELDERSRWSLGLITAALCGVVAGRFIERRRALESATAIALTDPLTGLANRRAWEGELRREVARARRNSQRLALVMLDLDHFKQLNDTQGHQAGDSVLAEAAASWRGAVRTTDFLARYGGDEFAMLLPDCPDEYGETVLERVRTAIPPGFTCSAGIAYWNGNETAESLLARADAALLEAKRSGRNTAVTADGSPHR
jgi:diguanylate cyclase (GGDEF)-like protein